MQPVCVFIIIVLGFIALLLLLSDSNSKPVAGEYYPSGATALDSQTTLAGGRPAGPLPANPAKMFVPPRNPAFGAADRFMIRNAKHEEREKYVVDPNDPSPMGLGYGDAIDYSGTRPPPTSSLQSRNELDLGQDLVDWK